MMVEMISQDSAWTRLWISLRRVMSFSWLVSCKLVCKISSCTVALSDAFLVVFTKRAAVNILARVTLFYNPTLPIWVGHGCRSDNQVMTFSSATSRPRYHIQVVRRGSKSTVIDKTFKILKFNSECDSKELSNTDCFKMWISHKTPPQMMMACGVSIPRVQEPAGANWMHCLNNPVPAGRMTIWQTVPVHQGRFGCYMHFRIWLGLPVPHRPISTTRTAVELRRIIKDE